MTILLASVNLWSCNFTDYLNGWGSKRGLQSTINMMLTAACPMIFWCQAVRLQSNEICLGIFKTTTVVSLSGESSPPHTVVRIELPLIPDVVTWSTQHLATACRSMGGGERKGWCSADSVRTRVLCSRIQHARSGQSHWKSKIQHTNEEIFSSTNTTDDRHFCDQFIGIPVALFGFAIFFSPLLRCFLVDCARS